MLTKIITQYGYDIDGRITKNTDGNGNIITGTWGGASGDTDGLDGLLKSVQYPTYREDYKFDNRNRKTQVSRILNATTRYTSSSEYDARGNVITQIDALNRKTKIDYDALSRPIKTTDALNGITKSKGSASIVFYKQNAGSSFVFCPDCLLERKPHSPALRG